MALREHPPIPYVPEKDSVQETVSAYKDNHLKTLINNGMELQVPIWHSGTCKVFLIHVGSAQEAIKKNVTLSPLRNTSREGLRQVNDDMYQFLLVMNFGGR